MQEEKKLYPFRFAEIQDLGYLDSPVENGWLAGNTISEIMDMYMDRIVGEHVFEYYGRQFPVLVRTLDGAERTPLLVCPDDEIAEQRFDFLGKAKFWYVRDAKPGAKLYLGLREDVSAEAFYRACLDGSVETLLNAVEPHAGDSFFIAPGTVHAALEGVSIIEIAESSPLDFRLCDWGRPFEGDEFDAELTLEAAFDFIDYRKYCPHGHHCHCSEHDHHDHEHGDHCHCKDHDHEHDHHAHEPQLVEKLTDCDEFTVSRIRLTDPLHIYGEQFGSFLIYTCLQGSASVQATLGETSLQRFPLEPGVSLLVPAELGDFFLVPDARDTLLLETQVEKRDLPDSYLSDHDHCDHDHCDHDHCDHDHCDCDHHHYS